MPGIGSYKQHLPKSLDRVSSRLYMSLLPLSRRSPRKRCIHCGRMISLVNYGKQRHVPPEYRSSNYPIGEQSRCDDCYYESWSQPIGWRYYERCYFSDGRYSCVVCRSMCNTEYKLDSHVGRVLPNRLRRRYPQLVIKRAIRYSIGLSNPCCMRSPCVRVLRNLYLRRLSPCLEREAAILKTQQAQLVLIRIRRKLSNAREVPQYLLKELRTAVT